MEYINQYTPFIRESAGVGEPGQTVNLLPLDESVQITPLPCYQDKVAELV